MAFANTDFRKVPLESVMNKNAIQFFVNSNIFKV